MNDEACVAFLHWALPRLQLRWPGFRRVRKQVCKRLLRRMVELNLPDSAAYRAYLERHPEEWPLLDQMCQITISRFYRDQAVFMALKQKILPRLADVAKYRNETTLSIWSAGCASGEEPYTLALLWKLEVAERFPDLRLEILATEINPRLLERAHSACYPFSSVRALPVRWLESAFRVEQNHYCLKPEYKAGVVFRQHDIREAAPFGPFHLIFCRNMAFTYFDGQLQREILKRLEERLLPGGILVIGGQESLPSSPTAFKAYAAQRGIYQKKSTNTAPC